jgi:aminoglycoside 2'-N-acetyltransferase I
VGRDDVVWDPPHALVTEAAQVRRHVWADFDGHDGRQLRASGLSSVATHPQHLRRGHGRRLVQAVRAALSTTGIDLAIFTCDRELGGFYVAAGWDLVPDAVLVGGTVDDPFRSDQFDKVVLVARFTDAGWAADLDGRDIALYPGSWDRLW